MCKKLTFSLIKECFKQKCYSWENIQKIILAFSEKSLYYPQNTLKTVENSP